MHVPSEVKFTPTHDGTNFASPTKLVNAFVIAGSYLYAMPTLDGTPLVDLLTDRNLCVDVACSTLNMTCHTAF